jgi:hypothetical protein
MVLKMCTEEQSNGEGRESSLARPPRAALVTLQAEFYA